MSAVVSGIEDEDPETGQPIWRLTLKCGHQTVCGRRSAIPPPSRPGQCRACKARAREQRKWIKRKAKQAAERKAAQAQPTEAERAWEAKIKTLMAIE
jgi:hypothetical protein